ncbi:Qri7p [Sugiyamaella lignohabitans]|uniref:N(6)-L-threonylcarbamoyladenine synthase n=1 Tax=Sugiyamaella lignohabitans TaxID=796027 RepID=A0A167E3B9_9ASCO|nr:Qri7p [Sugiyamaella lignohabitans]ANB13586.1 Qri7p [Sugiyamaella lignohabitans]
MLRLGLGLGWSGPRCSWGSKVSYGLGLRKQLDVKAAQGVVTSRKYMVLAIESSCDDSAVCLIDRREDSGAPVIVDHVTRSLDTAKAGGIIPIDAVAHHLSSIAPLVSQVLERNGLSKVDLVCATKGPGMFSSLSSGFNLAKGLSIAWNVPLIGVHHMLGHLLTPRFFTNGQEPKFPFLCLLTSGGHTMLVLCKSLFEHEILANTMDVAIGNSLDKCAREIGLSGQMLGKELELFINERDESHDPHCVPAEFAFPNPLQNRCGRKDMVAFSFASFISVMGRSRDRIYGPDTTLASLSVSQRREIGHRAQTAIFNHLASKVRLAIQQMQDTHDMDPATNTSTSAPIDFVCSGGVASNKLLREMLSSQLGSYNLKFHYPDPKWCTDNALMIGWAGIELHESGLYRPTELDELPIPKWPLDEFTASA